MEPDYRVEVTRWERLARWIDRFFAWCERVTTSREEMEYERFQRFNLWADLERARQKEQEDG